jgi:hypothetical protein
MNGHSWKKTIVISFVLGAAGILTCIAALLSDLVPTWSILAFIAVLIPLGLVIVGILAAFVWICDKCEDYFGNHIDKMLEADKRKPGVEKKTDDKWGNKVLAPPRTVFDPAKSYSSGASRNLISHASLRGSYRSARKPPKVAWHGQ